VDRGGDRVISAPYSTTTRHARRVETAPIVRVPQKGALAPGGDRSLALNG
jgi:hypothetical protein